MMHLVCLQWLWCLGLGLGWHFVGCFHVLIETALDVTLKNLRSLNDQFGLGLDFSVQWAQDGVSTGGNLSSLFQAMAYRFLQEKL